MKNIFRFLTFWFIIFLCKSSIAQISNPVKWEFETKRISDCEYELIFKGTIEDNWHVYSLTTKGDGPMPANITIKKSVDYETIGKPTEGKPIKAFDKVFEMDVAYFEKTVIFKQKIKLKTNKEIVVTGEYEYQACTEEKCIFPPADPFEFKLKGTDECKKHGVKLVPVEIGSNIPADSNIIASNIDSSNMEASAMENDIVKTNNPTNESNAVDGDEDASIQGKSWWMLLLNGFIWGLAALLTPCVFPLIPMNVSFFLKRSKDKTKGRLNAALYSLFIIIIFVALGLLIGEKLNDISTDAPFNIAIFILLLIFAASFLGAFEIVLPSKFVNAVDKQSDRGGFVGIFFMALALVVISFSCTGPMVSNAIVAASGSGNKAGAFWAMLGFSSGLALPFGLFAFFPSMLNSMPKSGGWLNAIKVVLGFLELALALKFASNVDLVYQLGILTREVFITLWVVIFAITTIYLLGGFKTSHDSDVKYLSVTRLFFVILSFSFTIYLIPGLWGAPLKLLSGILPPLEYSESPHGFGGGQANNNFQHNLSNIDPEFASYIEINKNGIIHFKNDYDHALAYAKKTGKPLLVDFTGHACGNCRKTEEYIWPDSEVLKRLNNDVVLVSLYVDDKRTLDPKEYMNVFWYGKERTIKTIGDKFKYLEETKYKQLAQPLYVLLDNDEKTLNKVRGYKSGIDGYIHWLDEGINEFKKRNNGK